MAADWPVAAEEVEAENCPLALYIILQHIIRSLKRLHEAVISSPLCLAIDRDAPRAKGQALMQ